MPNAPSFRYSPFSATPRSNPATYTGLLDHIRKAFAKANKDKGAKSAYFSANHLGQKGRVVILDEPTVGLHPADIEAMLALLDRIVDSGRTVVVIEHHQAVMAHADWVIDMGPEGGAGGGMVVAQGTPEEVATVEESFTGQYLAEVLAKEAERDAAAQ